MIEILVLDFCGCMDRVFDILIEILLDVFNYNLEIVLCLYKLVCLGVDYKWLFELLCCFKEVYLNVKMKFGLMVGLGEEISEIEEVLCDLCEYNVDMLIVG